MSQDEDKKLAVYSDAVESFENLETLFLCAEIDFTQIIQGLQSCFQKVENIILEENVNGSYLIDLFQMKQHILQLQQVIQNKIKKEHIAKNVGSASKLHIQAAQEKEINFVKGTIEMPRSNGLKDIAGLWEVKKVLRSLIILPRRQPQLFVNLKACNSILLFGPPGTGKTRLVHALAYEANAILHSVSVSDIVSPLVGQTEKNVQALFDYIRNNENFSILFIDEIDGFCRTRNGSEQDYTRRMKTELMCRMSEVEENKNIFLICATNCPWDLDTAFLRRFQKRLYIPLPNTTERLELFRLFTSNIPLENHPNYWEHLVNKTEGFSGSDISSLVTSALNIPIVELEDTKIWKSTADGFYEPVVSTEDFNTEGILCCEVDDLPYNSVRTRPVQIVDLVNALHNNTPTVSSLDISKYDAFVNK